MTKLVQASDMPTVDRERDHKSKVVLVPVRPHHTCSVKNLEHFSTLPFKIFDGLNVPLGKDRVAQLGHALPYRPVL
jgi:hypothetical protein